MDEIFCCARIVRRILSNAERKVIDMILTANKSHLNVFVDIYNSAIGLFDDTMRGNATTDTFIPQFEHDENMIEIQDDGEGTAFMSYHRHETCYELTSLYVKREYQRRGGGQRLLRHFEAKVPGGSVVFVKVLKNAPWSIKFYEKNGFLPVTFQMKHMAAAAGMEEKPWSMILYKKI